MKLLTKEIKEQIPALYSQDGKGDDAIAYVKFFTPDSCWTWYVLEGQETDDGDWLFFGLVQGFEEELGYFSLSELENIRGTLGLPVERDLFFKPTPIKNLRIKG